MKLARLLIVALFAPPVLAPAPAAVAATNGTPARMQQERAATTATQEPAAVEASLTLDRPTWRLIQRSLRNEGLDPCIPDALFGPRMRAAIRDWQQSRGTEPTEYPNSAAAKLLRAAAAPPAAMPSPRPQVVPAVDPSTLSAAATPASTAPETDSNPAPPAVAIEVDPQNPAETNTQQRTGAAHGTGIAQLPLEILLDRRLLRAAHKSGDRACEALLDNSSSVPNGPLDFNLAAIRLSHGVLGTHLSWEHLRSRETASRQSRPLNPPATTVRPNVQASATTRPVGTTGIGARSNTAVLRATEAEPNLPVTHDIDGLYNTAKWLTWTINSGLVLVLLTVLVKCVETDRIPIQVPVYSISVALENMWVVFTLFTWTHVYFTGLFIQKCYLLFRRADDHHKAEAWRRLTDGSLLWFNGLKPREYTPDGGPLLPNMDLLDSTAYLALAAAIMFFVAVVRVKNVSWFVKVGTLLAGATLVFVNWVLGTHWVLAASELTVEGESHYLSHMAGLADRFVCLLCETSQR